MSTSVTPTARLAPTEPEQEVPAAGTRGRWRSATVGVAVVLPLLALYGIFLFWPLIDILLRSFDPLGEVSYTRPNFSFTNFTQVGTDSLLRIIELRTLRLALYTTLITTVLGFPVAYLLSRMRPRRASLLLLGILVPFFVPTVVRLFSLTVLLSPDGVVNSFTEAIGLGKFPLLFNTTATVIGMTVYQLPVMILILYAGLSRIDTNLTLAAHTLGASPTRAFFTVYLPQARPTVISGMLFTMVLSLSFFLVPSVLGGPRDQTMSVFIQQQIELFQWGQASAMGIVLLIITMIGYGLTLRLTGGATVGVPTTVAKGTSNREPLRGTPAVWGSRVVLVIVFILLLAPVLVVFPLSIGTGQQVVFPPRGFTLTWFSQVFTAGVWIPAFTKSVIVGISTAVLSVALALSLSRTVQRIRNRALRSIILAVAFAPVITPHILLAIGLYDVEIRLHLIGSNVGLIMAHTVIAFPLAFSIINSALAQSDITLEQAAWTMGSSRTRTFWLVVVRSKLGSIVSAGVAAFMVSWDDVVIAQFQNGLSKTLPVVIYSYLDSGVVPAVPAISSMLVLLVIVGLVVSLVVGRVGARRGPA
ncbi:ABC transporter permease subunit [Dactylosporangium sp. NPDC051485]|uniref:ABC transporter permease subunit n=1 Tax=Dactylosporangium sp. NPDC051485 TaxID=3154846 RepID=UPI00342E5409